MQNGAELSEINSLQDGDVGIDLCAMALRDAFRNPDDVAHLLLLKTDQRVEDAELELLQKRIHVEADLCFEEAILERFFAWSRSG